MSDQIKEDEMGGACGMHGRENNVYRFLVEKPEGKNPLGRPRQRKKDNIKINLKRNRM
jgi:hypothetical protein